MKYYAINRFDSVPGDTFGRIISVHRSPEAALKACEKAQPKEQGAYLPTAVVQSSVPQTKDIYLSHDTWKVWEEQE